MSRGAVRLAVAAVSVAWVAIAAATEIQAGPDDRTPAEAVEAIRADIEADRWAEALDRAEAAAAAWPGDPDVRTALGEALWRAGRPERAAATFEDVVAEDRPPARALVGLGLVRSAEGRWEESIALLDRALAAAPDDRHVRYWTSGTQPTREAAIRAIERYLEIAEGDDPDRIEGARGTLRFYRALGEREIWVPSSRPPTVEVELDRLRGLDGRTTGWGVDVALGTRPRPIRLLFDTGSPGLFLIHNVARKRGLEPLSEETTFGGGGSGRHRSGRGLVPSFELGGLTYADVLVTTTEDAIDDLGRYKGLLGTTGLDGYRIVVDLDRGRLSLAPPPETPEPGGAPYWTVAGQLLIRAEAVGGPEGLFLLDTGATRTLLDLDFARRIGEADVGGRTRVRSYGGLRDDARIVEDAVLRFAGHETDRGKRNAVDLTQRSRLGGVQISGFLGLDLWNGKVVVIDTVHRRVWLRDPDDLRDRTRRSASETVQ